MDMDTIGKRPRIKIFTQNQIMCSDTTLSTVKINRQEEAEFEAVFRRALSPPWIDFANPYTYLSLWGTIQK